MPRKRQPITPEKPPRRKPGTGRVRSRSDGRYELTWTTPNALGQQIEQRLYLPQSEYTIWQAHAELDKEIVKRDAGMVLRDKITLAEYLPHWLQHFPKRIGTDVNRARHCRLYLIPNLGHLDITEVTRRHCQALWEQMRDRGKSQTLIQNVRSTLIAAFRDAQRDPLTQDLIEHNPAAASLLPLFPAVSVDDDDEERRVEIEVVRAILETEPDPTMRLVWMLCAYLGMRIGEVLGLAWSSLDKDGLGLRVRQTLFRGQGEWVLNGPKTTKSKRWLPLFGNLIPLLAQRKAQQQHEQQQHWDVWFTNRDSTRTDGAVKLDLIFTRPNGLPIADGLVRWRLAQRCHQLGVDPITPHQFRHTTNPLLLELGIPGRIVEKIMGHSNAQTNRRYTHTEEQYLRDNMSPIEEKIRRG